MAVTTIDRLRFFRFNVHRCGTSLRVGFGNEAESVGNMKMRVSAFSVTILMALAFCPVSRANFTNENWSNDPNFVCTDRPSKGPVTSNLTLSAGGYQTASPGNLYGALYTDSSIDPTLTLGTSDENNTSFNWTGYYLNIFLPVTFTLTVNSVNNWDDADNTDVNDWNWTLLASPFNTGSNWEASVEFYGGTPVPNDGSELDYSYTVHFAGSTQYSLTQEMMPVPEPATVGLVGASLLLGAWTLARRRQS